jgi:hypothetical protein
VDLPLPPPHAYTIERATAEAVGVELNRLQNIVITLDKVKHCLNVPDQVRSYLVHCGNTQCLLSSAAPCMAIELLCLMHTKSLNRDFCLCLCGAAISFLWKSIFL